MPQLFQSAFLDELDARLDATQFAVEADIFENGEPEKPLDRCLFYNCWERKEPNSCFCIKHTQDAENAWLLLANEVADDLPQCYREVFDAASVGSVATAYHAAINEAA